MVRRVSERSGNSGIAIGFIITCSIFIDARQKPLLYVIEDCTSCRAKSKQARRFRRPRPPAPRWRFAKLLAILAHDGGGRPQPDSDFAIGADKGAFGRNAPDNIFGGHRPPG
jgi:hypothetical protein